MLSVELVSALVSAVVLSFAAVTLAESNKLTIAPADAKRAKTIKHLQVAQIVLGAVGTLIAGAALYELHSGKSIGKQSLRQYAKYAFGGR